MGYIIHELSPLVLAVEEWRVTVEEYRMPINTLFDSRAWQSFIEDEVVAGPLKVRHSSDNFQ